MKASTAAETLKEPPTSNSPLTGATDKKDGKGQMTAKKHTLLFNGQGKSNIRHAGMGVRDTRRSHSMDNNMDHGRADAQEQSRTDNTIDNADAHSHTTDNNMDNGSADAPDTSDKINDNADAHVSDNIGTERRFFLTTHTHLTQLSISLTPIKIFDHPNEMRDNDNADKTG